jgi:hypothetical protein
MVAWEYQLFNKAQGGGMAAGRNAWIDGGFRYGSGFINALPQDAGGLKHHHFPGSEDKILFGLGVAATPGIFTADTKFAETADQDIFIPGQGIFDNIHNAFHSVARFKLTEPDMEINIVNNLFFGQGHGRNSLLLPKGESEPANSYATIIIHL